MNVRNWKERNWSVIGSCSLVSNRDVRRRLDGWKFLRSLTASEEPDGLSFTLCFSWVKLTIQLCVCLSLWILFYFIYLFIYLLFFHAVIRRLHGHLKKDERGILLIMQGPHAISTGKFPIRNLYMHKTNITINTNSQYWRINCLSFKLPWSIYLVPF